MSYFFGGQLKLVGGVLSVVFRGLDVMIFFLCLPSHSMITLLSFPCKVLLDCFLRGVVFNLFFSFPWKLLLP